MAEWLGARGRGWVRIKGLCTPWHNGDIDVLVACGGLRGLIVHGMSMP